MNPSFAGIDLVDKAASELLRPPSLRTVRERLPDVQGELFQVHPPGAAEIVVRGVLASSVQATAALAAADLKTRLRARQVQVGQAGTYRGVDGQDRADCLLASVRQAGPVSTSPRSSGVQAVAPVEARVVTQP